MTLSTEQNWHGKKAGNRALYSQQMSHSSIVSNLRGATFFRHTRRTVQEKRPHTGGILRDVGEKL